MYFSVTSATAKKITAAAHSVRTPSLTVKYLAGKPLQYSVVVAKKQGNAVQRNRVKRVIREIVKRKKTLFPAGYYLLYFRRQCDRLRRDSVENDLDEIILKLSEKHNEKNP